MNRAGRVGYPQKHFNPPSLDVKARLSLAPPNWSHEHAYTANGFTQRMYIKYIRRKKLVSRNEQYMVLLGLIAGVVGWWDRALTNHFNRGAPPALGYGYG